MELKDKTLDNFRPQHDFLVCIDSDGCAFDTMEIKHKECFCPAAINGWDLQGVSSLAREVWEFVNLYSRTRGCSRFNGIIKVLDLLSQRPEARERGFKAPPYEHLRHWVETAPVLNNDAVRIMAQTDPEFERVLRWSLDANRRVAELVHGIPPFPYVRETLEKLSLCADIVICSATPREALLKEWKDNGIDIHVSLLGAQEDGSKKDLIAGVRPFYAPDKAIMIGDAPGDWKAAKENGILFYPIRALDETASWREFYTEASDLFLCGNYAGEKEKAFLDRFLGCLPEDPPWKMPPR